MLVFVDEYGDTGQKFGQGSTDYMAVLLVIFQDADIAQQVDERIMALRTEIGKGVDFEFHFKENSNSIRKEFFRAVAPFEFTYTGLIVNKARLQISGLTPRDQVYRDICGEVFEQARDLLEEAIVKIDRSGGLKFRQELVSYLRKRVNDPNLPVQPLKRIDTAASKNNNLLQMADMVCGAVARSFRPERKHDDQFRKIIAHREVSVRLWPEE